MESLFSRNVLVRFLVNRYTPFCSWTPTPTPTIISISSPTPVEFTGNDVTVPLDLPTGAKTLEMVLIPAGSFTMGSPEEERGRIDENEWPPHQVTLQNDFYMGKYEVTQAQYEAVMGLNPSYYRNDQNKPVERVSWFDAAEFCNRVSEALGLQPVYAESSDWPIEWSADGFRLPTEAEWEYACRMGTSTRFSFGDAPEIVDSGCGYNEIGDQYMWWCGNNAPDGTKEVGLKLPNSWGLFDMHGNVWEWCNDCWEDPYNRGSIFDPINENFDAQRVGRGGDWNDYPRYCRSACRLMSEPEYTGSEIGFRIVLVRSPLTQPTLTPIVTSVQ